MPAPSDKTGGKRVALYLRVSTGKQAQREISIPDQRRQMNIFCAAQGFHVVDEFSDAKSARTGKRKGFQALIEAALRPDKPFDLVLVHSFSRYFRDGIEGEIVARKLRAHGVELQSLTQPVGNDPMGDLCRRMIALFDEYLSAEISKHVRRSQKENALQGFWNGGPTPFGYRAVVAERRGDTVKKELGIKASEAELVTLIFERYLTGEDGSGPMGVKRIASWLDQHGYRTRKGKCWGTGSVHKILTDPTYKGSHIFNRDADNADDRIVVPVPSIVDEKTFDLVAKTLKARAPVVKAPRVVTNSNLLTGMVSCCGCESGMTTATGKTGKYKYYKCSPKLRVSTDSCNSSGVPMQELDSGVLGAVSARLFDPERLKAVFEEIASQFAAADAQGSKRISALQGELDEAESELKRLYAAIAKGLADLEDSTVSGMIEDTRDRRNRIQKLLSRAQAKAAGEAIITPAMTAAFARLIKVKLQDQTSGFRRAYLEATVDKIEVQPAQPGHQTSRPK